MKRRKKILIITDSVSMPRPGVPYEQTWIYLLKRAFSMYDVIDRPGRGSTSTRLVTEGGGGADLLETYMPDMVILQIGMADCAPRLFNKRGIEFRIVSRYLPTAIRQRYIAYVKRHRVRDPNVTEVPPDEFRRNIALYLERCGRIGALAIIIPILPPTREMIRKSPHVRVNVVRYNAILREEAARAGAVIVDPFNGREIDSMAVDELHIDAKGMRMIFRSLRPFLTGLAARNSAKHLK